MLEIANPINIYKVKYISTEYYIRSCQSSYFSASKVPSAAIAKKGKKGIRYIYTKWQHDMSKELYFP